MSQWFLHFLKFEITTTLVVECVIAFSHVETHQRDPRIIDWELSANWSHISHFDCSSSSSVLTVSSERMQMKATSLQLLLLIVCSGLSVNLSVAFVRPPATHLRLESSRHNALFIRGGEQQQETVTSSGADASSTSTKSPSAAVVATLPMTILTTVGEYYGNSLRTNPILTKSVTAGIIFMLSDYLAQRLEDSKGKLSWKRMVSGGLVGLLYFGPAAHYWYDMIFRLLPGTSLVSTLQKALMGQLFFGPSFTVRWQGVKQKGGFAQCLSPEMILVL